MLNFEWDDDKNKSNQAKHNISFEDATDVFNDQDRLQFELEKNGEWRNLTIGKAFLSFVTVVYTIRNLVIRIISARRASHDERRAYLTNKFNKTAIMNNKISVSEALQRIAAGQPVSGYTIDFDRIKVEALDVMKLAKAGFEVPEEAIYYDDDDIAYDEDFEGDWQRVPTGSATPSAEQTVVSINLPEETRQWIAANHVNLDHLLTNLLDSFYRAQKMVTDKS